MRPNMPTYSSVLAILERDTSRLTELISDLRAGWERLRKGALSENSNFRNTDIFRMGGVETLLGVLETAKDRILDPAALVILRNEHYREILRTITENPGRNLKELAALLGRQSSNVSPGVAELESAGMLVKLRAGQEKRHFSTPWGEVALAASLAQNAQPTTTSDEPDNSAYSPDEPGAYVSGWLN